jgi:hypothetical protein
MSVGTGNKFNTLLLGIGDHVVNLWIKKRFAPVPKKNQKHIIPNVIYEIFEHTKVHSASRPPQPCCDGADHASEIAVSVRLNLKMGWITPGTRRFHIDGSFYYDPVDYLPKWNVSKSIRDLITINNNSACNQGFYDIEEFE